MLVKSTGRRPLGPAFPAARSAVRGPVDRAGAERLQAVVDGEQLDRVARPHEAALDHPDADPAPAGGQRPGHARLGERIDVATGRAGAVVGEGRLADAERPPGQRPQVDAPGDDVAAVLPVLHGDPGGLRDAVEVLAGDERDLALVDVGPVARPGGVPVAVRRRATLAASGGSTPAAFLAALAERAVPWEVVHVFQVDERVAPPGHPDRNLTGLRAALLDRVAIPPGNVHPMPVEEPDPAA